MQQLPVLEVHHIKENAMQKWQTYAVLEGTSKTVSGIAQDLVGRAMTTIELGCVAAMMIGIMQAAGGFIGFWRRVSIGKAELSSLAPNRAIIWAILFGFMAGIPGTIVSLYTFTLGAEFSARTLLISASIIPGAILGRYVWGSVTDPLGLRQWIGMAVFIGACWAILGFPGGFNFEPWVWWTLVITFTQPVNEFLSRKAADAKLDPWTNNFWVGTSTVFWTFLALVAWISVFGSSDQHFSSSLVLGSLLLGLIVTGMISFKLLSYAGGGTIALKKVIMQGTYLVTFTFIGIFFYHQPFTGGHLVGILLFLPAFALIDKDTWKGIQAFLRPPQKRAV